MGFTYAYSMSDEEVVVKDFPLATGVTPARGDVVILNGSGQIAAAGNNAATVLGVYEGGTFQGIGTGGAYAATAANTNSQTNTTNPIGKVRISHTAVYRVPLKAAASAPTIGTKYGCASGTAPSGSAAVIDTANTATGAIFQVVDYDATAGNCFVIIVGSAFAI